MQVILIKIDNKEKKYREWKKMLKLDNDISAVNINYSKYKLDDCKGIIEKLGSSQHLKN